MNNLIVRKISDLENRPYKFVQKGVEKGSIAIMYRGDKGIAIGRGLKTKINVNLGTSSGHLFKKKRYKKRKLLNVMVQTLLRISQLLETFQK